MHDIKEQVSKLRNNKTKFNDFDLQDIVKFYAENAEILTLGEEVMVKGYIREGAKLLNIDMKDIQQVYNSYRRK